VFFKMREPVDLDGIPPMRGAFFVCGWSTSHLDLYCGEAAAIGIADWPSEATTTVRGLPATRRLTNKLASGETVNVVVVPDVELWHQAHEVVAAATDPVWSLAATVVKLRQSLSLAEAAYNADPCSVVPFNVLVNHNR